jgi:hypothetical protein
VYIMSDSNLLIEQNLYFDLTTSEGKEISEEEFQSFIDNVITPLQQESVLIVVDEDIQAQNNNLYCDGTIELFPNTEFDFC